MPEALLDLGPRIERRINHSVFLAARPDPRMVDRISEVWNQAGTGDALRRSTLHLSIVEIGEFSGMPPDLIGDVRRALDAIMLPSFDLVFDRLSTWTGRNGKPIVLTCGSPAPEMDALAITVQSALVRHGLRVTKPGKATPHITLAYGAGFVGTRLLDTPLSWTVDSITLIDSLVGKGQHVSLGDWLLDPCRPPAG